MANSRFFGGDNCGVLVGAEAPIANIFAGGGTVSCWANPDSFGTNARFMQKGPGALPDPGWRIHTRSTENISFGIRFSNNARWDTNTTLTANTWVHVAITYNSDSTANDPIIYFNAVSQAITEDTTPSGTVADDSAAPLYIGSRNAYLSPWIGYLSQVQFWDRILSQSEIADAMNTPGSVTSGLVGWWPLNFGDPLNTANVGPNALLFALAPEQTTGPPVTKFM